MHKTLENIYCWCYPLLRKWGIGDTVASYTSLLVNIAILSFLTYIIYMIFRFFLVTVMAVAAKKTPFVVKRPRRLGGGGDTDVGVVRTRFSSL